MVSKMIALIYVLGCPFLSLYVFTAAKIRLQKVFGISFLWSDSFHRNTYQLRIINTVHADVTPTQNVLLARPHCSIKYPCMHGSLTWPDPFLIHGIHCLHCEPHTASDNSLAPEEGLVTQDKHSWCAADWKICFYVCKQAFSIKLYSAL